MLEEKNAVAYGKYFFGKKRKLFLTVAGETRKLSAAGELYGWPVSVLEPMEQLWGRDVERQAQEITPHQAEKQIRRRIRKCGRILPSGWKEKLYMADDCLF